MSLLLVVALVCAPLSIAQADEVPAQHHISGTVTSGGTVASDVRVDAYDDQGMWVAGYWTDRRGVYNMPVPAGAAYRLEFSDSQRQTFRTEYWNDQPTLEAATPIVVGTSDVTGKDADLARNPQIRGVVSDEDSDEIEGADVDVFRLVDGAYQQVGWFQSGVDGHYRAPVEAGGTYKIRFRLWDFRTKWLGDSTNEAGAAALAVTTTITGKDVRLTRAPVVTGVVSGPSGPVPYARVTAYRQESPWYFPEVNTTTAGKDGSYSLGLEPGEYRIGFAGGDALTPEYYDNSATVAASTPVTIDVFGRTIDATLAANPTIRGTVRSDVDGAPLAGISVSSAVKVANSNPPFWTGGSPVVTGPDGTYALPVPVGTHRVFFYGGPDYRMEYDGDTPEFDLATSVDVGSAGATVDASLAHNPTVSGVVTGPGGTVLAGVQVSLLEKDATGRVYSRVTGRTGADGSYELSALPGSYALRFRDDRNGLYRTEYLGNSPTKAGAEMLELSEGTKLRGVDAELAAQAAITGTVTGPDGPAAGVVVSAVDLQDDDPDGNPLTTTTSATGDYSLALEDGTYRLYFTPPNLLLRPEFWKDALLWEDARDVVVEGSVVTNVDAKLEVGSGVSGTVSVIGDAVARYVDFYARDADGDWAFYDNGYVNNGVFDTSLPPGTYRVKYDADWHDPIYYGGSRTIGRATDVVVTEGAVTQLGDVTLGSGASVINEVAPTVSGTAAVGSTLTANDGTWGPASSDVALSRQWLRNGELIEGATGKTYTLVQNDFGARIAVRVRGISSGLLSLSKNSAPTALVAPAPVVSGPAVTVPVAGPPTPIAVAKANASVKVSAKGAKKKATLTITVKAPGVTPTGKVTIRLGGRTLKSVTLKNGRAKIALTKQKKGARTYKVVYSGDPKVRAKLATSKVKIK